MQDARLRWRKYVLHERPDIPAPVKCFALALAEFSANGIGCRPSLHQLAAIGYPKSTAYRLRKKAIEAGILKHNYTLPDGRLVTSIDMGVNTQ